LSRIHVSNNATTGAHVALDCSRASGASSRRDQ
jgi:hypothetical protein